MHSGFFCPANAKVKQIFANFYPILILSKFNQNLVNLSLDNVH
jgi:hypothetical protein